MARAQGVPHQFFDSEADGVGATIDGVPVENGTVIEAWNENGELVASTKVVDGLWLIRIDPDAAATTHFSVGGHPSPGEFTIESGAFTFLMLAAASTNTRDVPLTEGWNTVGALRPGWNFTSWSLQSASAEAAFEQISDRVSGIFRYETSTLTFSLYVSGLPANLNSLREIAAYDPLWVFVSEGSSIEWPPMTNPEPDAERTPVSSVRHSSISRQRVGDSEILGYIERRHRLADYRPASDSSMRNGIPTTFPPGLNTHPDVRSMVTNSACRLP